MSILCPFSVAPNGRVQTLALDIDYAAAEIRASNAGHYVRFNPSIPVLRLYTLNYSTWWYWIVWFADVTLFLLPCIERPAYFLAVPQWVALIIEIFALSILFASFVLSMRLQDVKKLLREAIYPYVFLAIFTLTTIDMIIYYSLTLRGIYYVRWSRPFRVLFPFALQVGQNIRRVVRNILRTLPNIGNVLVLFLLSIITFTLLGVGILRNKQLTYPDGTEYFTYHLDTAWDLYVLTTTANNPDVMMPAYNSSILYVIFFGAYLLVNLYLFMNLLLAVIFSNYKQHLQAEKQLTKKRQAQAQMEIFQRLSSNNAANCVPYETFSRLMYAIKPEITEKLIEAYWVTLTDSNTRTGLDLRQFNELVFNLNFDLLHRNAGQTFIQRKFPLIYYSKPSQVIIDFVNTDLFRTIITVLIIGNAVCLAIGYDVLEWLFLSAFILELILKMYTMGVKEYFRHRWNIFDFVIIFVSTLYSILTSATSSLVLNRQVLDSILVIRILRLVKLVGNINRFKVILGTFSKVIPTLLTYLRVMLMTYYVFAMLGMEIFQYKIAQVDGNSTFNSTCNNTKLAGSEFARAQYCRNNFNDFFSSLILLFELTVVNQWHVLASGYVLVTSKATRLFFLAFHLCAVIVVLNIFTAFVIDSFLNQYSLSESGEFPWIQQENTITERLNHHGFRVIRRYKAQTEHTEGAERRFDLKKFLLGCVRPSIYRQMASSREDQTEDDRVILLRWSGDLDCDPEDLLNLTERTT